MTSEQCINIIKNRLIALVDSGQLKATYKPSNSTISFYVNDIDVGERPLLTLRLSDHNPEYWSYVQQGLTPPYEGDGVNVSIEFYRPKKVNGRKLRNRVDTRVKVPPMVNGVVPFVVNSYDYTPEKLEETDIDLIYDAILSWINGGYGAKYIDPFANTPKKAKVQSKNANITWNIAHNISVDKDGNYVSANGWGADFVSESMRNKKLNCNRNMNKKLIRLTESDLHRIVRESVNRVLREAQLNELDPRTLASYASGRHRQADEAGANGDSDMAIKYRQKAYDGEQAARDKWNKMYGFDSKLDNGDYYQRWMGANKSGDNSTHNLGSKYGIHYSSSSKDIDGIRRDRNYAYNPKTNKEYSDDGAPYGIALNSRTKEHEFDPGDNGAHRIAREMELGNGKHIKGKGWQ